MNYLYKQSKSKKKIVCVWGGGVAGEGRSDFFYIESKPKITKKNFGVEGGGDGRLVGAGEGAQVSEFFYYGSKFKIKNKNSFSFFLGGGWGWG